MFQTRDSVARLRGCRAGSPRGQRASSASVRIGPRVSENLSDLLFVAFATRRRCRLSRITMSPVKKKIVVDALLRDFYRTVVFLVLFPGGGRDGVSASHGRKMCPWLPSLRDAQNGDRGRRPGRGQSAREGPRPAT